MPIVAPYLLPQLFGALEGRAATWAPIGLTVADFDGDGCVNVYDLAILANNYGSVTVPCGAEPVPEPATLAVLAAGGLALMRRKRRY